MWTSLAVMFTVTVSLTFVLPMLKKPQIRLPEGP
jgi:hypothetical protein